MKVKKYHTDYIRSLYNSHHVLGVQGETRRANLSYTNWAENQPDIYGHMILSALEDMTFAVSNHLSIDEDIRAYAFCV